MLSAFKNFGITFLIAAIIFGLVAFFVTSVITDTVDGILSPGGNDLDNILNNHPSTSVPPTSSTPTSAPGTSTATEEEILGESFDMLIVVSDTEPGGLAYPKDMDELQDLFESGKLVDNKLGVLSTTFKRSDAIAIILLRVDKENKSYSFTSLSSIMRVSTPAGDMLLGDLYTIYGLDFLKEKVSALTGVTVDKEVILGSSDISNIAAEFDGITFNVPVDIYYNGEVYGSTELLTEYENIKKTDKTAKKPELILEAGVQFLSADDIPALFLFRESSSSTMSNKASMIVGCTKAYMSLVAKLEVEEMLEKFDIFVDNELITTNLTKNWIEDNSGIIAAYANFDHPTVAYPGTFKTLTDDFGTIVYVQPNITNALNIFKK